MFVIKQIHGFFILDFEVSIFRIYMIKVDKIMKTGYNYVVRKVRNILLENGGFYMELAKVTSKGQVTIPIEIRKKLGIKNGDKILFVEGLEEYI